MNQATDKSSLPKPGKLLVNPYKWWWWRSWHGMRLGTWLRLLARNRFRVHPSRWALAASITATTPGASMMHLAQQLIYGRRLARTKIDHAPIFIVGHWRSGTTYLHELMVEDERFTSPTSYECFAVNHALLSEWMVRTFFGFMVPKQRPMDNMSIDWDAPQEEEFALMILGVGSNYLNPAFANEPPAYLEYLDLQGLSDEDLRRWKEALLHVLRIAAYRRPNRRLVLKSPPHTGRIKVLKEMFPGAKFVHMVRDPFALFPSTVRLWDSHQAVQGLQVATGEGREEYVFECFDRMYRAFERDREQLDPGSICDVRYEDLVAEPVEQVRQVYDHLSLAGFDQVRPKLEAHAASKKGYRPNRHQLDDRLTAEIARRWGGYFEKYGYSSDSPGGC